MNQLSLKKMNQITKKKKKGFTLIELIIVIAIIAVLAAIAIPKFGAAKHNADVAADQANAKIIATAVSTAVANGDITNEDHTTFTAAETASIIKYIDGGAMPKAKTGTKVFTVTYDYDAAGTGKGAVVTTTEGQMYPIS